MSLEVTVPPGLFILTQRALMAGSSSAKASDSLIFSTMPTAIFWPNKDFLLSLDMKPWISMRRALDFPLPDMVFSSRESSAGPNRIVQAWQKTKTSKTKRKCFLDGVMKEKLFMPTSVPWAIKVIVEELESGE